jgi:hypothetical protein
MPPSTRYATKWALKIFDFWRAARKVKEMKIDDVGFKLMILAQSRH